MLIGAALLGIVGTWSDVLGSFPWWRLVVVLLVIGLVVEFIVTRQRGVRARWRDAERLFLGRPVALELELSAAQARALTVRTLPVLPNGIDEISEPRPVPQFIPRSSPSAAYERAHEPPSAAHECDYRPPSAADGRAYKLPTAEHERAKESPGTLDACELRVPQHGARIRVAVRPLELGQHTWPMLPVRVLGPARLAWWSKQVDPATTSVVLPDTLGRRAEVTGSAEVGAIPRSKLGGGHELHQLREYRPGDPRNTIDWKATARSSKLITRVYTEDQHLEIMLLLDIGRTSRTEVDGMSQLGHYVNLAARFAEYCASGDDRVGLVVFADRPLKIIPPGRGIAGLRRVRHALAGLKPQPVESDALEAALAMRRTVRHRSLAVILTDLYETSSASRLVRTARLLARAHLPMMVGLLGGEITSLGGAAARNWLDPYRGLAARSYERQVNANAARLTELGALALTARPEELDAKVLGQYRRLRTQHRI